MHVARFCLEAYQLASSTERIMELYHTLVLQFRLTFALNLAQRSDGIVVLAVL